MSIVPWTTTGVPAFTLIFLLQWLTPLFTSATSRKSAFFWTEVHFLLRLRNFARERLYLTLFVIINQIFVPALSISPLHVLLSSSCSLHLPSRRCVFHSCDSFEFHYRRQTGCEAGSVQLRRRCRSQRRNKPIVKLRHRAMCKGTMAIKAPIEHASQRRRLVCYSATSARRKRQKIG